MRTEIEGHVLEDKEYWEAGGYTLLCVVIPTKLVGLTFSYSYMYIDTSRPPPSS